MARLANNRSIAHLTPFNVHRLRQGRDYVIPICPSDNFSSNCFDIINQEEYDIYDYLNATDVDNRREREREKNKRMIFFYGEDLEHVQPYCYHMDYIQHIDPLTSIYTVDCKKNPATGNYYGTAAGSDLTLPLLKIDLKFPIYVYLHHFMEVMRSGNRIFLIMPSEVNYERTASLGSLDYVNGVPNPDIGRYVSADHCQDGTNKRVCSIYVCPRDVIDEYLREDRMPLNVRYGNVKKSVKSKTSKKIRSRMRREENIPEEVPVVKPVNSRSRKPRASVSRVPRSRKARASASRVPRSRKARVSASRVSRSRKARVSASRVSRSRKARASVSRVSRSRKASVSRVPRSRKARVSASRVPRSRKRVQDQ